MSSYKTFDNMIKNAEAIDVDGSAMLRMVSNKSNLMPYEALEAHQTIDSVLGKNGCVILLYQQNKAWGHWTCLFKSEQDKSKLLFFDSYGIPIDQELKFSKFNTRKHQGQITPHLSALIDKSNYTVESNTHRYQKDGRRHQECGSHVATRIIFRHMGHKQYQTFMTKNKQDADYIVVAFTLLDR